MRKEYLKREMRSTRKDDVEKGFPFFKVLFPFNTLTGLNLEITSAG